MQRLLRAPPDQTCGAMSSWVQQLGSLSEEQLGLTSEELGRAALEAHNRVQAVEQARAALDQEIGRRLSSNCDELRKQDRAALAARKRVAALEQARAALGGPNPGRPAVTAEAAAAEPDDEAEPSADALAQATAEAETTAHILLAAAEAAVDHVPAAHSLAHARQIIDFSMHGTAVMAVEALGFLCHAVEQFPKCPDCVMWVAKKKKKAMSMWACRRRTHARAYGTN